MISMEIPRDIYRQEIIWFDHDMLLLAKLITDSYHALLKNAVCFLRSPPFCPAAQLDTHTPRHDWTELRVWECFLLCLLHHWSQSCSVPWTTYNSSCLNLEWHTAKRLFHHEMLLSIQTGFVVEAVLKEERKWTKLLGKCVQADNIIILTLSLYAHYCSKVWGQ